jgi:glycerol-3-phosphate acyltransferase PlsY
MNMILIGILGVVAYFIGNISPSTIMAKRQGLDIKKEGSGNAGTTNALRVMGKKAGAITCIVDILKGVVAVLIGMLAAGNPGAYICALCVFLGHVRPIVYKFKGGKGVSTAAGAILALSPLALIGAALVWGITFFTSRYVSLASILAAGSMPIFLIVLSLCKVSKASIPEIILFILLAILTVLKHSSNIKRLREGTENRFDKKSK